MAIGKKPIKKCAINDFTIIDVEFSYYFQVKEFLETRAKVDA